MNETVETEFTPTEEDTWVNPTDQTMQVVLHQRHGSGLKDKAHAYRVVFPPGKEVKVMTEYRDAIQRVMCNEPECRSTAWKYCLKGHAGSVIGGLAPQLVRKGANIKPNPDLDPDIGVKEQLAAAEAQARLAKHEAEGKLALAQVRKLDAETAASKKSG